MSHFTFVHVADIHLGYEQYNLSERREDFDRAFTEVVDKTVELKPDFMIVAGDLFHQARPLNITLERAIRDFKRLRDANIPVLVVDGSHDTAPNIVTSTILNPLDSAGLIYYLPRHNNACWESEYCYVYGIPNFRTRERTERQLPAFYESKKPTPRKDKFNVFVFHMALDIPDIIGVHPKMAAEASPELLPEGFKYYAGGHIHMPLQIRFQDGVLAYSGSTETVSYEDALSDKGFYYVEVNLKGDIEINRLKLESPRKFKVIDKDYSGLSPQDITELAANLVKEADEEGVVIVPVLKGMLPAESARREIDLARIRGAAEKALAVHPLILLREMEFPEEVIRNIFESEMKDLKAKSYEYFVQFFSQRYNREEAEKRARITLDLVQYLVRENEDRIRDIIEGMIR
ncbi:MAG: DNA repair exonuclease [Candidatus Bathyarchaeia archaeon]